jgi:hypothetical protein
MYPTVNDPASALTFAPMHRDELIADARARRQAREATQVRRAQRRRRKLIH